MQTAIVEEMYNQIANMPVKNFSLTFQGGEPALAGREFYENALKTHKKIAPHKNIAYSFQTNGLLIDDDWAKFLKTGDFLVGLSIDGPEHIHNKYRKFKNGRGSFNEVMRGLAYLMKNQVPVNAMCCLTDYSALFPDEIYDFYKSLGVDWLQFIPVVERDRHDSGKAADFSLSDKDYGDFLIGIFEKWLSDFKDGVPTVHIKYFESIFYTYLNLSPPDCTMGKNCGVYLVVEHNGDVYSCDFFVEPDRKLGNIMNDRLEDIFHSSRHLNFGKQKSHLPEKCTKCAYSKNCFGGCIKDRMNDPLDNKNPRYCHSFLRFMKVADPVFEKLALDWRKKYASSAGIKFDHDSYDASDNF